MGRSGGSQKRKLSSKSSMTRGSVRNKKKTDSMIDSLEQIGIPEPEAIEVAAEISLAVKKSTDGAWISGEDFFGELTDLAKKGVESLDEKNGFARGQAILSALNSNIRGAALAQAYADREDLYDYLRKNGISLSGSISPKMIQNILERSLGRKVDSACNQSDKRKDLATRPPRGFIVSGDQIFPSSEYYGVSLGGVASSVVINRDFDRDGVLRTRLKVEARRRPRKWSQKKNCFIDREGADHTEDWGVSLEFSGEGDNVTVFISNDGPALQGKSQEVDVSMEEIIQAGGPANWAEKLLEDTMREDREWEDANPKKAQKRHKEDKKRRKKLKLREEEREQYRRDAASQAERERQASVNSIGSRSVREALGGSRPLD